MKTSILISTFAALCLMFNVGEAPTLRNVESVITKTEANYSVMRANMPVANRVIIESAATKNVIPAKVSATSTEDFSYLKFNTKTFATESESEELPVNEFSYLKFNTNAFATESEELPVNEFNYMKFNTSAFSTEPESEELPVNEFSYLKFNVNAFATEPQSEELPVNEFSYLKFDVNKISAENPAGTYDSADLPINE